MREFTLRPEDFIYEQEIPRFIGSLTGRSGTTWLERIFRHSFIDQMEMIGERHFFWLSTFRSAPTGLLAVETSEREAALTKFCHEVLTYAHRTRLENGHITYGGLARLLPRRGLRIALDRLSNAIMQGSDIDKLYEHLGRFYQWLFNYWSATASGQRKPWISKEPAYGPDCELLLKLVPNAKLLVLARDGRDVALSMKQAGWVSNSREGMVAWKESAEKTVHGLSTLPKTSWHLVRYEDLTRDFDSQIHEIIKFFGLEVPQSEITPRPRPEGVGQWKGVLTAGDQDFFTVECGPLMERLGYDR
jgi:hypothetical protein